MADAIGGAAASVLVGAVQIAMEVAKMAKDMEDANEDAAAFSMELSVLAAILTDLKNMGVYMSPSLEQAVRACEETVRKNKAWVKKRHDRWVKHGANFAMGKHDLGDMERKRKSIQSLVQSLHVALRVQGIEFSSDSIIQEETARRFWRKYMNAQKSTCKIHHFVVNLDASGLCKAKLAPLEDKFYELVSIRDQEDMHITDFVQFMSWFAYPSFADAVSNFASFVEIGCLHPRFDDKQAEEHLMERKVGTFVTRRSRSNPETFTLSRVGRKQSGSYLQHFLIYPLPRSAPSEEHPKAFRLYKLFPDSDLSFPTVTSLLRYYMYRTGLFEVPCCRGESLPPEPEPESGPSGTSYHVVGARKKPFLVEGGSKVLLLIDNSLSVNRTGTFIKEANERVSIRWCDGSLQAKDWLRSNEAKLHAFIRENSFRIICSRTIVDELGGDTAAARLGEFLNMNPAYSTVPVLVYCSGPEAARKAAKQFPGALTTWEVDEVVHFGSFAHRKFHVWLKDVFGGRRKRGSRTKVTAEADPADLFKPNLPSYQSEHSPGSRKTVYMLSLNDALKHEEKKLAIAEEKIARKAYQNAEAQGWTVGDDHEVPDEEKERGGFFSKLRKKSPRNRRKDDGGKGGGGSGSSSRSNSSSSLSSEGANGSQSTAAPRSPSGRSGNGSSSTTASGGQSQPSLQVHVSATAGTAATTSASEYTSAGVQASTSEKKEYGVFTGGSGGASMVASDNQVLYVRVDDRNGELFERHDPRLRDVPKVKVGDALHIQYLYIHVVSSGHWNLFRDSEVMIIANVKKGATKEAAMDTIVLYDESAKPFKIPNQTFARAYSVENFPADQYGHPTCFYTPGYEGDDITITTHAWEIDDTRVQEAFVRGAGALVSAVGSIPALGTYGLAFQLAGGLIQAGASLVSILNTNDRLARSHTIGMPLYTGIYVLFADSKTVTSEVMAEYKYNPSTKKLMHVKEKNLEYQKTYYVMHVSNEENPSLLNFDFAASASHLMKLYRGKSKKDQLQTFSSAVISTLQDAEVLNLSDQVKEKYDSFLESARNKSPVEREGIRRELLAKYNQLGDMRDWFDSSFGTAIAKAAKSALATLPTD